MLLIMIPDQYPNYYKALEIYTGYFDGLDIMILFSYPSSIVKRETAVLLYTQIALKAEEMLLKTLYNHVEYLVLASGAWSM